MLKLFCTLLLSSSAFFAIAKDTIRFFAADNHTYQFVMDALQLAIDKNPELSRIRLKQLNYIDHSEGFRLTLLDRDVIDIYWTGTTAQREQDYAAIPFPITKGLLGQRLIITHKDNLQKFDDIKEEELKTLIACQGVTWPDTAILKKNGYTVATASQYMQLVNLTNKKRCDYFPRAVYEGLNEIPWLQESHPDLRLVKTTMLSYRFPIYFFLRKSDQKLAEQIHKGLLKAVQDNSYQDMFNKHLSLKYLHPLNQWQSYNVFELENHLLSAETPTDKTFWFHLKNQ